MARVLLKNVTKKFGKVIAVSNATIEAEDGEFLVLLGPSGCGKTTTLRMIAGLEEADTGDVFIGEQRVNDLPPKDRDIAMVFQNYALYPHMNVYQNISFGLKLRKMSASEIDERVKKVALMLHIEELMHRKPKELSGGQRQRVALARAIVRDPKVYLMDEPLSNLDAKLRVQTREELIKLHRKLGVTTVYVTHDQVEAMTLGTRVVVMEAGFIKQIGTPKEVYDFPSNKFVAGFVGTPPMNFLNVEVKDSALYLGKHRIPLLEKQTKMVETYKKTAYDMGLKEGWTHEKLEEVSKNTNYTFGIRPEDIHIKEQTYKKENLFETSIILDISEMMGSETYLHFDIENQRCVAKASSAFHYTPGDNINIVFDLTRVHLFDIKTQKAIF